MPCCGWHEADKAVPVFEELVKGTGKEDHDDYHHLVRVQAARALWQVTGRTDAAVTSLIKELESDNPLTKQAAAGVLAEMGPGAKPAIPGSWRR